MLIVLDENLTEDKERAQIQIALNENKWVVTYKEKTFTFNPDLVDFAPDMAHLGLGCDGLFLYWTSSASGDKTGFYHSILRNRMWKMEHIASFFICEDKTTHMYTRLPALVDKSVTDVQLKHWEKPVRSGEVFAEFIPEAAAYIQRNHTKRKMLGHININNSLAMLEAQLDMLTQIVLDRIPLEERTEMSNALMDAVADTSVVQLHSIEKLKETIQNAKSYIRNEQRIYFSERGDSPNNDPSA